MTAQVPAEGPFYSSDGSFLGYVGQTATLVVQMVSTQEEGPPLPQDLSGRLFQQRIESTDGDVLLTVVGINGWQGVAHGVSFPLLSVDTQLLLPSHAVARDMVHVVGEVTGDGFEPIFSAPFALRRLRRSGGATVLQLEPNVGIVLVRYAGAPPLSLMQSLINSGDLPEDAVHADLVAFLQRPAAEAGQAVLDAISPGGVIEQREELALAALDAKLGEMVAEDGPVEIAVGAAVSAELTALLTTAEEPGGQIHEALTAVGVAGADEQQALVAIGDEQAARLAAVPALDTYATKADGDDAGLPVDRVFYVANAAGSGFDAYHVTGVGTSVLINTLADQTDIASLSSATPSLAGAEASVVDQAGNFIGGMRADGSLIASDYARRARFTTGLDKDGLRQIFASGLWGERQITFGPSEHWDPQLVATADGPRIFFLSDRFGFGPMFHKMTVFGQEIGFATGKIPLLVFLMAGQSEMEGRTHATAGVLNGSANTDDRILQLMHDSRDSGPRVWGDGATAASSNQLMCSPGEITGTRRLREVISPSTPSQANLGQTISTAFGQSFLQDNDDPTVRIGISVVARGGMRLSELSPGGISAATRNNWPNTEVALDAWQRFVGVGDLADYYALLAGVILWQGQSDSLTPAQNRADRKAAVLKYYGEFSRRSRGTAGPFERMLTMLAFQNGNGRFSNVSLATDRDRYRDIELGLLDAVDAHPNIHMCGPTYQYTTFDGTHVTAAMQDLVGDRAGIVMRRLIRGEASPAARLKATGWEIYNGELLVPVESYTNSLVRTTTGLAARTGTRAYGDYSVTCIDGFSIWNPTDPALALTSVTFDADSGGMVYGLTHDDFDGTATLNAALDCTAGSQSVGQDPLLATSIGCNWHDEDDAVGSKTGLPLPGWVIGCQVEGITGVGA